MKFLFSQTWTFAAGQLLDFFAAINFGTYTVVDLRKGIIETLRLKDLRNFGEHELSLTNCQ